MSCEVVVLTEDDVRIIKQALKEAAEAAMGDSNDEEIEALQQCRDLLSNLTGIEAPDIEEN